MKITLIEKQKNNPKRYSIYIDGKFSFSLDEIDILYYKLLKKDEITEDEYNIIIENCIYKQAKDAALRYLAFKARTELEVKNKLLGLNYKQEIIEKVIEFLHMYRYIDDEKYASSYFKDKFNLNGYGKERIKFELKQRGISSEIIEKAYNENEFDETEKAIQIVIKRYKDIIKSDCINMNDKNKIVGFLKRRGYSFEIINEVFIRLNIKNI